GVNWVDFGTAIGAAFGALLALMARERTGRGQEVNGSLMATALTVSNSILIEQEIAKPDRVPQGNLGYGSAPADLFKCADGRWLIVQVVGQPLWQKFCRMLGADDWIADPRFADDLGRGRHSHVVSERLGAWCAARPRADALQAMEDARIPAGPVHSPQDALDDAHVRASGILHEIAYPGAARPAPVADTPVRLSATPGAIRRRARPESSSASTRHRGRTRSVPAPGSPPPGRRSGLARGRALRAGSPPTPRARGRRRR